MRRTTCPRRLTSLTHRRTLIVAAILVALAASHASAQNPFFIDGNIADGNNSGVAPGATKTSDLNANVKELGAKNTNTHENRRYQ